MKARLTAALLLPCLIMLLMMAGCEQHTADHSNPAPSNEAVNPTDASPSSDQQTADDPLLSGIMLNAIDQSVKPGEDFFTYANGEWLKNTEIPADKSNYGSFTVLADEAEANLKTIIEEVSSQNNVKPGSAEQKIRDFYLAYMNEASANAKGYEPLAQELTALDAINSKQTLFSAMGKLRTLRINQPVVTFVNQDSKQATQYALYLTQSGLTLPDRDYYLEDNERFANARELLKQHVKTLFELTGQSNPADSADAILALETELAENHWSRVDNRDRDKTYNKFSFAELQEMSPGFDWLALFGAAQIPPQNSVIVRQPDYIQALPGIIENHSLETWKAYLKFKLLDEYAAYLSEPFVEADFAFQSKGLQGIDQQRPRWKRAIESLDENMGELLGQIYVDRHFQSEAKQRMVALVENLREAYRNSIIGLDWMGEDTKLQALDKLNKFKPKIGYPDVWRDYTQLVISPDNLVDNIKNGTRFDYQLDLAKLGSPIDRNEWFMTPQTVNAYYNPPMNEIVFPAAILQPPFFNLYADDAVNYGGIGAVIGHEMGHGFDDQGSKSDGDGNLRNWWTDQDRQEFQNRTQQLVDQYAGYEAIDGEYVNGELTLGENIGDLGGLSIAYKAWQESLNGQPSPVIDGLTGQQRFFLGWAQVWQRIYRDEELKRRLNVDPHSPSKFRVNGIVTNMPEFYEAFEINPDDQMYTKPENRVKIW